MVNGSQTGPGRLDHRTWTTLTFMSAWWPMTKEGAERLQRYLGRTWSGFLLAGVIGVGIGYEIKRNKIVEDFRADKPHKK